MNTIECSLHKSPFLSCTQLESQEAAQVSTTEPLEQHWATRAVRRNILHVTSPNAYSREHV